VAQAKTLFYKMAKCGFSPFCKTPVSNWSFAKSAFKPPKADFEKQRPIAAQAKTLFYKMAKCGFSPFCKTPGFNLKNI